MAVNMYDQPAQAQFVNTYTPIPFQEMVQAGAMKQQQFEQGDRNKDMIQDLYKSIEVAPFDLSTKNEKLKQINNDLSKLVDENPDMGSYEFRRALDKYKRTLNEDTWWTSAQQNKDKYKEFEKSYLENKKNNRSYNYSGQENLYRNLWNNGTQGLIESGQNVIADPGAIEYKDFNKSIDDSLDKLKASGYLKEYYTEDGMKIKKGSEGVTRDALTKAVLPEMGSFMQTKEGVNFYNSLRESLGKNPTDKEFTEAFTNLVNDRAGKFIHSKSTNGIDYDDSYAKKLNEDKYDSMSFPGEAAGTYEGPDYSKSTTPNSKPTLFGSIIDPDSGIQYHTSKDYTSKTSLKNEDLSHTIGKIQGKYNLNKKQAIDDLNNNAQYWLGPQFNNYNVLDNKSTKGLSIKYDQVIKNIPFYDSHGKLIEGKERDKILENKADLNVGSLVFDKNNKTEGAVLTATITNSDKTKTQIQLPLPSYLRGVGTTLAEVDKLKHDAIVNMKDTESTTKLANGAKLVTKIYTNEGKYNGKFGMNLKVQRTYYDKNGKILQQDNDGSGKPGISLESFKQSLEEQIKEGLSGKQ